MRVILIIILTIVTYMTFPERIFAKDTPSVFEITPEELMRDILTDTTPEISDIRQKKIDDELSRKLEVKLIPVDLEDCIKIAVEMNYQIKEKGYDVKEKRMNEFNAMTELIPDAAYVFSISHLSGTYLVGGILPVDVDEIPMQSYFEFKWSLNKFRPFFNIAQKKKLYDASLKMRNFSREEAILNTALSYYNLLRKKAELDIYTSNLTDRRAQYELTKARYLIGVGTKFDMYRSDAEVAKSEQQYIQAIYDIRYAQAQLAVYMGISVLAPLYPKENFPQKTASCTYELYPLIEEIPERRKDVLAMKDEISALKTERNAFYTDFLPDIDVTYTGGWYGTQKVGLYPSSTINLTVKTSLGKGLGAGTATNVLSYNAKIKAKQVQLAEKIRDIEAQTIKSFYEAKTAEERIVASKTEVFASTESLKNSIVQMQVGTSTFIDVIQAQNLKINADIALATNITDYNKAKVQLLFDAGIITVENTLEGYKKP